MSRLMSDQTITSLIEKLEGASEGSTKLDCYVELCARTDGKGEIVIVRDKYVIKDAGGTYAARQYTTSLDAALALAERVLPGWWWTAGRCGLTCHASVGPDSKFIGEPDLSKFDSGFHADVPNPSTPAIALCIAILRAQSEAR